MLIYCSIFPPGGMKRVDIVLPISVMLSSYIPMSIWVIHLGSSLHHLLIGLFVHTYLIVNSESLVTFKLNLDPNPDTNLWHVNSTLDLT